MSRREWTRGNRVACLVLVFAAVSGAFMAAESLRVQPLPDAKSARDVPELAPAAAGKDGEPPPPEAVLRAVARDPFRPNRQRPPDRYRPPAARRLAIERARRMRRRPNVRVYGTAARPGGGGVAALKLAGNPARTLSIGDTLGEWTLIRVKNGSVMLAGRDTILTFHVQRPVHMARRQQ